MNGGRGGRVERALCWALIGVVALVAVVALRDSWLRVGRVSPGFALMENGDEILGQGGDVNETAGDGLMVIFQDPDPRRHAVAAALAGLGVLRRTAEINAAMDVEPGPPAEPIGVHVGVNSGVAAVGATRIEGLAGTRWTYTASGPVTNVAARLAALGAGDAVMLGGQTRWRLGPEFAPEDLGETELRNIDEPVRVFRLRPPPEEASARAVPAAGGRD